MRQIRYNRTREIWAVKYDGRTELRVLVKYPTGNKIHLGGLGSARAYCGTAGRGTFTLPAYWDLDRHVAEGSILCEKCAAGIEAGALVKSTEFDVRVSEFAYMNEWNPERLENELTEDHFEAEFIEAVRNAIKEA